jgi:hypothetical protein
MAIGMKNLHIERLKRLAKQHHRTQSGEHFEKGVKAYRDYDGLPPERLTWWDDVAFILNDYRVELAWHHPRMAYEDAIEAEQAMRTANFEIRPFLKSQWCKNSRIIYLCVPIEIRNETDLHQLVVLTRRLLKREVTLSDAFPSYRYTRADWEREGLSAADTNLYVHKVL